MSILTFKDQSGYQIKVNSPDGSTPSEADLDRLFAMSKNKSNPDMQGGANAPALQRARQDVAQKTSQNQGLDTQTGVVNAAYNATWPVSMMMKKAMGDKGPNPQSTSGGSKMLEAMGMMANPLTGEAVNAVGKTIGMGSKAIGNVMKFSKPVNQIDLAQEVQSGLAEAKHNIIESYGEEYDRIIGSSDKKVNLNSAIKNFVDEGQSLTQNPGFVQQLAARNPQAQKVMDLVKTVTDEKIPEELSAKEADNLSKAIKNLPGIKTKLAQASKYGFHTVQWSNEDRMLLGLADDIKSGVIEAHPELASLNQQYGQFMNAYKKVAPDFKIGSTISKLKNYRTYDPQKSQLLEGILPQSTMSKVKDFSSANRDIEIIKGILPWIGGLAGGSALYEAGRIAQKTTP
jgi:hypothetical protein